MRRIHVDFLVEGLSNKEIVAGYQTTLPDEELLAAKIDYTD